MQIILDTLFTFWQSLSDMAIYLLLGFLLAGILAIFITPALVQRHLGKPGIGSVIRATLFGIPLPLCSCSVIPVASSLRKNGASRSATVSFLISTPQTGVDSILVTFSILGPIFAVIRPIIALVSGILGGILVDWVCRNEKDEQAHSPSIENYDSSSKPSFAKIIYAFQYGFGTLAGDIAQPLLIGILIAGALSTAIPNDFLGNFFGNGILGMLMIMIISIPLYVCATASVPIVATLIAKGVSPGTALVFLMTGPATNSATILTIWKVLGKKATIGYVSTISICAILSGLFLDYFMLQQFAEITHSCPFEIPAWLKHTSGLILFVILVGNIIRSRFTQRKIQTRSNFEEGWQTIQLVVRDLKCNNCAQRLRQRLLQNDNVHTVDVEYQSGLIIIVGKNLSIPTLTQQIHDLGYTTTE